MNFLAHASLSPLNNYEVLSGNLATDLLKPAEIRILNTGLKKGVALHHNIDRLTDHHPEFRLGSKRLSTMHGKYGRVVLDIIYDFLLARNWQKLMDIPLQKFADHTYKQLEKSYTSLPVKIANRFEAMITHNWLVQYGDPERLQFTFRRLAERASFPVHFDEVHIYIQEHEDLYAAEFLSVYQDVKNRLPELSAKSIHPG